MSKTVQTNLTQEELMLADMDRESPYLKELEKVAKEYQESQKCEKVAQEKRNQELLKKMQKEGTAL